jgi:hypothetical protein
MRLAAPFTRPAFAGNGESKVSIQPLRFAILLR